jgi:hypothetical protein
MLGAHRKNVDVPPAPGAGVRGSAHGFHGVPCPQPRGGACSEPAKSRGRARRSAPRLTSFSLPRAREYLRLHHPPSCGHTVRYPEAARRDHPHAGEFRCAGKTGSLCRCALTPTSGTGFRLVTGASPGEQRHCRRPTPEQIVANAKAADWPLSAAEMQDLDGILQALAHTWDTPTAHLRPFRPW